MSAASSLNAVVIGTEKQQIFFSKRSLSLSAFTNLRLRQFERKTRHRFWSLNVQSVISKPEKFFEDPDWKKLYQEEFEERFNLPHLKDVLDIKPRPTTFALKSRGFQVLDELNSPTKRSDYVDDDDRALLKVIKFSSRTSAGAECIDPDCTWVELWVHRAGPRKQIYFDPENVKAAIVTCGGLCPGLNDVIRQIVFTLETYGVKKIVGIPFGYRGFFDSNLQEIALSRQAVQNVNLSGGSFLGVSRGGGNIKEIVDSIQARGIDMLFVLGGNGTHAGANAIHDECRKRKLKVSVICVPKTIDNDILLMDKTFGFDTAVEEAQRAINSAYIEAHSAYHGIGLVKLMGRSSGFIAMHASLSSGQVDICLIPEAPFRLEGPYGVLEHLQHLIKMKGSAVVCIAEGAGQLTGGRTDAEEPSAPSSPSAIIGQLVIAVLVLDTWQYWSHRILHMSSFLYRHVHSHHHRLIVPYAFGAFYAHPVEGLADTMGGAVAYMLSGMSPRVSIFFFCLATAKNIDDHAGLWFPNYHPFHRWFSNNSAFHAVHHQLYGGRFNFSTVFLMGWDKLLGTSLPYAVVKREDGAGWEIMPELRAKEDK